jgi:hypothetical protein
MLRLSDVGEACKPLADHIDRAVFGGAEEDDMPDHVRPLVSGGGMGRATDEVNG